MRWVLVAVTILFANVQIAAASDLYGIARLLPDSAISGQEGDRLDIQLGMTQPVPFRIFQLADPYRIVIDFNELDFSSTDIDALSQSALVVALRAGRFRQGWSRLVVEIDRPMALQEAEITNRDAASVTLAATFAEVGDAEFRAAAGVPADSALPEPVQLPPNPEREDDAIRVVLDPGHGGIDPGAEVEGHVEAELMLGFARELKEALLRSGNFDVVLTREEDEFVSLERRVQIAHASGADLFISLHADVVLEGRASGVTIYTLDEKASDRASQKLAERHDRGDILAGVDLTAKPDSVARILLDLARRDTAHRSDQLADALVGELEERVQLYKNPRLTAGFSVLKSADIPSVLIELGFLNSPSDMANISDTEWRKAAAEGIVQGIVNWAQNDVAERELRRK